MLQLLLSKTVEGVEVEFPIPGSSKNGNTGRADIVYTHDGIVEIYEIKPGSYAPNAVNNYSGIEQLERYINNYKVAPKKVRKGTSLNSFINGLLLPSIIHPDKMIKYYVYPSDPGMIYWRYVNKKSNPDPDPVPVLDPAPSTVGVLEKEYTTQNKAPIITSEDVVEGLEVVAVVGVVAYGVWLAVKWSGAIALAPATGGASVALAACTP